MRDRQLARQQAPSRAKTVAGSFSARRCPTTTQSQAAGAASRRGARSGADWKITRALRRQLRPRKRSASSCRTTSRSARSSDARGLAAPRQVAVQVGAGEHHRERAAGRGGVERARSRRRCAAHAARSARRPRSPSPAGLYNDPIAIAQHARPSAPRCASCRCWRSRVPGVTMQTTGLASETIGGLYEGERLARRAARCARAHARALCATSTAAGCEVPCLPIVNPPLWELAHIAWFQEFWCLRCAATRDGARAPMLAGADALFDSAHRRPTTALVACLSGSRGVHRRTWRDTLEATLEALARSRAGRALFLRARAAARGHARRGAADDAADARPAGAAASPRARAAARERRSARDDVRFEGGEFAQGAPTAAPTSSSTTRSGRTPCGSMRPSRSPRAPVTQGRVRRVRRGRGIRAARVGGATRAGDGARRTGAAPRYWRREAGRWTARRFDRWERHRPATPMIHVTRARGRGLLPLGGAAPADGSGMGIRGAQRRIAGPLPLGRCAARGRRQPRPEPLRAVRAIARSGAVALGVAPAHGRRVGMDRDAFEPYPGFRADPYQDYSQPWFHYPRRAARRLLRHPQPPGPQPLPQLLPARAQRRLCGISHLRRRCAVRLCHNSNRRASPH